MYWKAGRIVIGLSSSMNERAIKYGELKRREMSSWYTPHYARPADRAHCPAQAQVFSAKLPDTTSTTERTHLSCSVTDIRNLTTYGTSIPTKFQHASVYLNVTLNDHCSTTSTHHNCCVFKNKVSGDYGLESTRWPDKTPCVAQPKIVYGISDKFLNLYFNWRVVAASIRIHKKIRYCIW